MSVALDADCEKMTDTSGPTWLVPIRTPEFSSLPDFCNKIYIFRDSRVNSRAGEIPRIFEYSPSKPSNG